MKLPDHISTLKAFRFLNGKESDVFTWLYATTEFFKVKKTDPTDPAGNWVCRVAEVAPGLKYGKDQKAEHGLFPTQVPPAVSKPQRFVGEDRHSPVPTQL
jgi:hypothetical protein